MTLDLSKSEGRKLSDEEIGSLADLLDEMARLEKEQKAHETAAKECKDKLFKLTSDLIPSRMDELGVPFIGLPDGRKVEVVDAVSVRVPKGRRPEAYEWLRKNGAGALIKNVVAVTFGKGEDENAAKLVEELEGRELPVSQSEDVHWKTMESYVKERLEKESKKEVDGEIPKEAFGVYEYRNTKVS
jgi:hypothetical protein